jgi:hypothetical protein
MPGRMDKAGGHSFMTTVERRSTGLGRLHRHFGQVVLFALLLGEHDRANLHVEIMAVLAQPELDLASSRDRHGHATSIEVGSPQDTRGQSAF